MLVDGLDPARYPLKSIGRRGRRRAEGDDAMRKSVKKRKTIQAIRSGTFIGEGGIFERCFPAAHGSICNYISYWRITMFEKYSD